MPDLTDLPALAEALRTYALSLPGAVEDHPWGETVAKVNKKVFVFLGRPGAERDGDRGGFSFSVKLPESGHAVLGLPFTQPTGYGLGKSGWVTVRVGPDDVPPLEMLQEWVEESWRAIAPKKLVATRPRS